MKQLYILILVFLQTGLLNAIENGGWIKVSPMTKARSDHAAVLIDSNRVLVAGGHGNSTEIYNIIEDTWSPAAPMLFPRYGHKLIKLNDNEIIAISGYGTLSCEIYNITDDKWSLTDSIHYKRDFLGGWTATLLADGQILIAGGINYDTEDPDLMYPRYCEVYQPDIDTWLLVDSLDFGRFWPSAVLLDNGDVLITGGDNVDKINQALLFLPESNTFAEIDTPAYYRYFHNSLLLSNGQVLIFGGSDIRANGSGYVPVEEFDIDDLQFLQTDLELFSHYAFELSNNQILGVGEFMDHWRLLDYSTGMVVNDGLIDSLDYSDVFVKIAEDQVMCIGGTRSSLESGDLVVYNTNEVFIFDQKYTAIAEPEHLATGFQLSDNYPNPFNPSTTIQYHLPHYTHVTIRVFNTNGQIVADLVNDYVGSGQHQVTWNGTNNQGGPVSSGVYYYRIRAGDFVRTKKMIFMK